MWIHSTVKWWPLYSRKYFLQCIEFILFFHDLGVLDCKILNRRSIYVSTNLHKKSKSNKFWSAISSKSNHIKAEIWKKNFEHVVKCQIPQGQGKHFKYGCTTIFKVLPHPCTLTCLINEHARLAFLKKWSAPATLFHVVNEKIIPPCNTFSCNKHKKTLLVY